MIKSDWHAIPLYTLTHPHPHTHTELHAINQWFISSKKKKINLQSRIALNATPRKEILTSATYNMKKFCAKINATHFLSVALTALFQLGRTNIHNRQWFLDFWCHAYCNTTACNVHMQAHRTIFHFTSKTHLKITNLLGSRGKNGWTYKLNAHNKPIYKILDLLRAISGQM